MLKIYVVETPQYDWYDGSYNVGFFQTLEGALDAAHAHWVDPKRNTVPTENLVAFKDSFGNTGLMLEDDGHTFDDDDMYTSYCIYVISKVEVK